MRETQQNADMSNSQRIKIYADINASGSPENYISKSKIEIRNANPVKIEVVFLENGAYADVGSATGAVAEILDVGDFNSPPPSEPLLLARSVSALQSPFEAGAACQKSANSTCNAVFEFPSAASGFLRDDENFAQRYLSIRLCMPDNSEISYADGWIFVRRNFSSDPNFNPISSPKYITKAETEALVRDAVAGSHEHPEYLEKSENLSDLADTATARSNLNVYSKSETYSSLEIDGKEALDLKKASNLSDLADVATARTNLGVYATSETYSKTEIDSQEALNLKKASNLSDLSDVATARTNLGVYSSTEVDAKVQSSAQALACSKQSRGELWFGGGKFATSQKTPLQTPFSYVWTWAMTAEEWGKISTSSTAVLGTTGYGGDGFGLLKYGTSETPKLDFYFWKNGSITNKDLWPGTYLQFFNGANHVWAIVNDGTKLLLIVDGSQIAETSSHSWTAAESTAGFGTFSGSTAAEHKMSRVMGFNFNIAAKDAGGNYTAPYSLADYQNGVDVPPALKDPLAASKCLLELENYTFEDGATQKIFDVSGNNNDATITGNVAGTHDVSVKRLIDFITAQNS